MSAALHPATLRARQLRKSFYSPRVVSPVMPLTAVPEPTRSPMHYAEPIGPLMEQAHDLRANGVRLPPVMHRIVCEVLCSRRMTWRDVTSTNRKWPFVEARWEFFYRLYEAGWSLPRIGKIFGRDHSTVLHGVASHGLKHGLRRICNLNRLRTRKGLGA